MENIQKKYQDRYKWFFFWKHVKIVIHAGVCACVHVRVCARACVCVFREHEAPFPPSRVFGGAQDNRAIYS